MTDWDASRYHRVSDPQFDWGQRVIARLRPAAGERILDLGCGTGRLTQEIQRAVPAGPPPRVVGLDRSGAMLAVARATVATGAFSTTTPAGTVSIAAGEMSALPLAGDTRPVAPGTWPVKRGPVPLVQADGAALPFRSAFDAVFSAATLHWIADHQAVFDSVAVALDSGGRLVAQCGGHGNLRRMLEHTGRLQLTARYRQYFDRWHAPWNFAGPEETAARLRSAGLRGEEAWLEEAPVQLETAEKYAEFVSCVCIRHHLDRLPLELRDSFIQDLTELAASDTQPYTLDYWRLNIYATKARG
jgi:trans-aconitate methyltransferase